MNAADEKPLSSKLHVITIVFSFINADCCYARLTKTSKDKTE